MNALVDLVRQLAIAAATTGPLAVVCLAAATAWERWAARNDVVWRPTEARWVTDRRSSLDALERRRP